MKLTCTGGTLLLTHPKKKFSNFRWEYWVMKAHKKFIKVNSTYINHFFVLNTALNYIAFPTFLFKILFTLYCQPFLESEKTGGWAWSTYFEFLIKKNYWDLCTFDFNTCFTVRCLKILFFFQSKNNQLPETSAAIDG